MNLVVLGSLDPVQLAELASLLTRCERADHHPALAEPQRVAASRPDLGGNGSQVVLAYEDSAGLVGCAFVTPALDGATALHVAVDPDHRTGAIQHELLKTALLQTALLQTTGTAGAPVRLWIMQATDADDATAHDLGFVPERDLIQMRVPLPLPPETVASARPITTRPFQPGRDDAAWLAINNAAFAGHPEQGNWTLDDLHAHMKFDWFDAEGFLVADRPDGNGLIGSCWTKIDRTSEPVLGEIYVISVDPELHSQGWGKALTVAGLQWMAHQGISVGMLYTSASNTAAVKLYESLGFTVDHVDRSYLLTRS
jgi:mycothiol synthase